MFTGIVGGVGRIVAVTPGAGGVRIVIDAGGLRLADTQIGDSIAVDGCCLTLVAMEGARLSFDVSAETVSCTVPLLAGRRINLELSLRAGDRLGGHLVAGHVDGVGTVARFAPAPGDATSRVLEIDAPEVLARFIAPKGSIALNGVSLTTNTVSGRRFAVNLIPHTLAVTNLGDLATGEAVNLEVDMLARYLERMIQYERPASVPRNSQPPSQR
jgi:riboflavin synthase